jgi:hypothetical protein
VIPPLGGVRRNRTTGVTSAIPPLQGRGGSFLDSRSHDFPRIREDTSALATRKKRIKYNPFPDLRSDLPLRGRILIPPFGGVKRNRTTGVTTAIPPLQGRVARAERGSGGVVFLRRSCAPRKRSRSGPHRRRTACLGGTTPPRSFGPTPVSAALASLAFGFASPTDGRDWCEHRPGPQHPPGSKHLSLPVERQRPIPASPPFRVKVSAPPPCRRAAQPRSPRRARDG